MSDNHANGLTVRNHVVMHVVTKGGEVYQTEWTADDYKPFDSFRYLNDREQYEYGLLKVGFDAYISIDCIAKVWFDTESTPISQPEAEQNPSD